jgi:hypothetical protein
MISEYLVYLKKSIPMVLKALLVSVILVSAPLLALAVRTGGSNAGTIIIVGFLFEVFAIVAFLYLIQKEYTADKPAEIGKKIPSKKPSTRDTQEIK